MKPFEINRSLPKVKQLQEALNQTDNVLIGAGAGLSASAGFTYDGERFLDNFSDFAGKYKIPDMYSGGFFPFSSPEEKWAFWSRLIYINRYVEPPIPVHRELLELVKSKNYFVITTNVDHLFQKAGFDKDRLFYTQGDYGLWQCSVPCHNKTYDNEEIVKQMIEQEKDMKVPSELIPYCPKCGAPMENNLRADQTFVQDKGWYKASERYQNYLEEYSNKKLLLLDLGVGGNTPVIIKYPFWQITEANPYALYACINLGEAIAPKNILNRSILIDGDIGQVINELVRLERA